MINGTGAPPIGPVDLVIEGNNIVSTKAVGNPGFPIDPADRPEVGPNGREIDLTGHYVLPGFIDMHGHIGGVEQGTPAEYVLQALARPRHHHGARPGCGNGLAFCLDHKNKSDQNQITAPRIEAYVNFGQGREEPFTTADQARAWVDQVADKGADGIKFFGYPARTS